MTAKHKPQLAVALVGDLAQSRGAQVKDQPLIDALKNHFNVTVFDRIVLAGVPKWLNMLRVFHPKPSVWRERFYKNVWAFKGRSAYLQQRLSQMSDKIEYVLQFGVLFNGAWQAPEQRLLVYTDYTAALSAQKPDAGRSPFRASLRQQWFVYEHQTYRQARLIFTRSAQTRHSVIEDYGIPAEKVFVVGAGVNPDVLSLPEQRHMAGANDPVILFIGKDFYRKGGDILLQAFTRLKASFAGARLQMVTNGPIPDELMCEGVEIIAPTWERETILSLYHGADIFVLPSRLETWGDVLLEAMACGLPCVGVSGDAMTEIIADQETGLIVPLEDPAALAAALLQLCCDLGAAQEMGRRGRQRVLSNFTWPLTAQKMFDLIDKYGLN